MSIEANITLLAMVRAEIDAALARVVDSLTKAPEGKVGDATLAQIHQVWGALRMVRLDGARRLCEEIETTLRESTQKPALDAARAAVTALREFINDVSAGGANVPVKMFAAYQDVARANGKENIVERDLFFPDQDIAAPAHPAARMLAVNELTAFLQAQRPRYQRALLAWLKRSDDTAALSQMREVLDAVDQVSASLPAPRALWWAAVGMIDGLLLKPAADWAARVKPVCGKLDFLLRDFAADCSAPNNAAAALAQRDVLYAVATCRPLTPRLRETRKLFQLDSLIPHAAAAQSASGIEQMKPLLDDARSRLENIKQTWTEYTSAEPKRLERFRELLPVLQEKTKQLGNAPLSHLLDGVAAVIPHLPDPYPLDGQLMSVEMASALLMAESILTQFHTLPDDLEQQVMIMNGWLVDAVQGKISTTSPPGLRADLVQQANDAKLRIATAREALKNLGQTEKILEAFSRDTTQRDKLPSLKTGMRQVQGVFQVLDYRRAADLLAICDRMIERCADPTYPHAAQDLEWIAEGLGSIGFYLEPCLHGKRPAERAINMFFSRYEDYAGAAAVTSSTIAVPVAPAQRDPAVPNPSAALDKTMVLRAHPKRDNEMLEVFLEEASEVLTTIEESIRAARKQPADKDAMMTMRRGFHTLKGGGRMVGLVSFGEAAWELEQVMNLWLEESREATPALLDVAADARAMFAQWVYELQDDMEPIIDPSRIAARARELRGGAPAPAKPVATTTPSATYQTDPDESDHEFLTIGLSAVTSVIAPSEQSVAAAQEPEFMTLAIPKPAQVPPPASAATTQDMHNPALAFERALEDLGDRLAWLAGLLAEMKTETGALANAPAAARVLELTQMMAESMDEAASLQRQLADQIAALKNGG